MSERVAILGAGSWGMAVAYLLDSNGHQVRLWEFDPDECHRLKSLRGIPEKLKNVELADSIEITNELAFAVEENDLIVLAVPAQTVRSVLKSVRPLIDSSTCLVNLSKGIEAGTVKRVSEIITEETTVPLKNVVALSGPSHAEEVVRDMPTTVVAAGASERYVEHTQKLFSNNSFRVYKSNDLVGVELGGALKNIIAIAAGICDGLSFGDNTKGALITRGLAEMVRLGQALGAQPETFAGLSGLGDLVTTCISRHSRNRHVGERIAMGEKTPDILARLGMVAEGVETTRSGYQLAMQHEVEMPITTEVYRVLFEDKPAAVALGDLMDRTLKAEIWQ
jgi:glycerol-3-phosphate dehydrogenase (NAD(P)+)